MNSVILSAGIRVLIPLFFLFSLYLLFRGHNAPGGGFVAGLVASTGFALYAINYGAERTRRRFKLKPIFLIALGLLLAVVSGLIPIIAGETYKTGLWLEEIEVPIMGKPGTPILFDIGVYLLVGGTVLKIIFSLWEE
ncbi:MAG: Na+/H+ antiporter subunit B [Saprospirales bacterium]|nr:MAG: Na+/H+ antiporter subunit B [Saprospirales bacterium]